MLSNETRVDRFEPVITIAYISARPEPRIEWFLQSLALCNRLDLVSQIVIVDKFAAAYDGWTERDVAHARNHIYDNAGRFRNIVQHVPPKPSVWSGPYRMTPRDWWSASSYRNTALCHAKSPFIAYLDDRCVLAPTWMDAVVEAMQKNYVVCGTYEKREGMVVREGKIVTEGTLMATDPRMNGEPNPQRRRACSGEWLFGCTFALPTEWMLQVNGFDESWDSVSMEDTHFGKMLENNTHPIFHDGRMKMIEDRTPREQDAASREHDMKRSSKEKHPNDREDKTHQLIRRLWSNKRSAHPWDMRVIRNNILRGGTFPVPLQPTHDWFDGQPLNQMT